MSAKTIMVLCLAVFAVVHSMPASKQAAPAKDMKTAETIWAPSAMLGYRSAYTMPSAAVLPLAYRSAVIPAYHPALGYESPMAYSTILDEDYL